jgi:hypothetical protein
MDQSKSGRIRIVKTSLGVYGQGEQMQDLFGLAAYGVPKFPCPFADRSKIGADT